MASMHQKLGPRFFQDMEKLMGLDEATWDKLASVLEQVEAKMIFSAQILEAVEGAVSQSADDSVTPGEISRILHGLIYMRASLPKSAEELAGDLIKLLEVKKIEVENGISRNQLGHYLERLFSVQNLFLSVKGSTLATDYERILIESKIVTDIRPIFENSNEEEILGYTLTHTLKLLVEGIEDEVEIFVALTEGALIELNKQIDRAVRKELTLKRALGDTLGKKVEEK